MSNKNYTKYSNQKPKNHRDSEEIRERNPISIATVDAAEVEDKPVAPKVNKKAGVVANCDRLNMRKEPSADSEILTVLDRDAKVVVEIISDDTFYKVCAASGLEGYCMKNYIAVRG